MSMIRTGFSTHLMVFILGLSASAGIWAQGANPRYQEGIHFTLIENKKPSKSDTATVVEAFSYMCTHCATFEPYISNWVSRLPSNVSFKRIPVIFGRGSWELYARAYVTAEVMGIADEAHQALMDRIWKDKKIARSIEELAEFYAAYGVSPESFVATSKSFAVDAKMRKDQRVVQDAGVRGTPSMVVNDTYLVAGSAAVGSYDVMLDVVDYLVAQSLVAEPAPEVVENSEQLIEIEGEN